MSISLFPYRHSFFSSHAVCASNHSLLATSFRLILNSSVHRDCVYSTSEISIFHIYCRTRSWHSLCGSYWFPQYEQRHSENTTRFDYKVVLLTHSPTILMCWHQYGHYHVKTCIRSCFVCSQSCLLLLVVLGSGQYTNRKVLEVIIVIRKKGRCNNVGFSILKIWMFWLWSNSQGILLLEHSGYLIVLLNVRVVGMD